MENIVIDNYKEHTFHEFWDEKCSTCYSEMQATLKKYKVGVKLENNSRSGDFDLIQEKSAHPEEKYW